MENNWKWYEQQTPQQNAQQSEQPQQSQPNYGQYNYSTNANPGYNAYGAAAAEFSFFMAIPTMLGASGIKLLKFFMTGVGFAGPEIAVLLVGCAVSFLVSLLVIRGLMNYVRHHSFSAFGVYRIVLGILVLAYFAIAK